MAVVVQERCSTSGLPSYARSILVGVGVIVLSLIAVRQIEGRQVAAPTTRPVVRPIDPQVRLTTTEGLVFEGSLIRTGGELVLTATSGQSRFRPWEIKKIESTDSFERNLQQQLILLDPRDTASRFDIVSDLRDLGRDDLAVQVLRQITKATPLEERAYKLLAEIEEGNMPLVAAGQGKSQTGSSNRSTTRSSAATRPGAVVRTAPVPRLTRPTLPAADINRIRQAELGSDESNVSLRFMNDVERRFARQAGIPLSDFKAQRPLDRFLAIRNSKDPLLLADVTVMRDPRSVAAYRRTVQPLILAGCAAAGCHSGGGSADPMLINPSESDSATYTNFFLLATTMVDAEPREGLTAASATDSKPVGGPGRLIDRINPRQSLLLEYGLPRDAADLPHPPVPLFRPAYSSREDRRYRTVLNFIASDLSPFEPQYGVTLPQPVVMNSGAATQAPAEKLPAPVQQP